MNSIKCYNCGESLYKSRIVAKRSEIRFNCYGSRKSIVECPKCKLIQLVPQWSNKELDKIYTTYNQKPDFVGQKVISKRISKYLNYYLFKGDNILEVGCGCGDNVKYFNKKGYTITGIDKDKSVEDKVNAIFNYDIYDENIHNKYDMIYGLHILEHMKDPIGFIDRLKNLLSPKGTILLEFPNLEDPLLTIYKVKEFEKFYYRPDHHFFYTPLSLATMLYGFKLGNATIERMQNYGIVNHLNWLIRKKPTNLKITIPIIDTIYKWFLTRILKKSDTIILTIRKV